MEGKYLFSFGISLLGLLFLVLNTFLFLRKRTIHSQVSKVFLVYLVSLCIIEISCHIIGILKPNSNFFISHFYFIFQFTFLSYLYSKLIEEKLFKKIIAIVYISQILILGYMYFSDPSLFWKFNEYEIITTSFILVFYAFYFIYKEMDKVYYYYNFSIGLILYLLCSISIFLYGNLELVLIEDPYIDIWIFNTIFYIIFQFMIFREYAFFTSKLYKSENEEDDVLLGD
jgi:hypothetical protein